MGAMDGDDDETRDVDSAGVYEVSVEVFEARAPREREDSSRSDSSNDPR